MYEVITTIPDKDHIEQTVSCDGVKLWHDVLSLCEEETRKALIALGWRPPE